MSAVKGNMMESSDITCNVKGISVETGQGSEDLK